MLAVCIVIALLTAWYAATRYPPSTPGPPIGSVRLGPESGEPVADYLGRLPGRLPAPGAVAPALVQLTTELTTGEAADLLAGSGPAGGTPTTTVAVLRVPVSRVQTALRFEPLDQGPPPAVALATARERAQRAAESERGRLTGRPGEVAAVEAAALADPGCRCVLALVVRADRAGLESLAAVAGVRAVDAGPTGVTDRELALSPLLPEQLERADPTPDDAPVPPR